MNRFRMEFGEDDMIEKQFDSCEEGMELWANEPNENLRKQLEVKCKNIFSHFVEFENFFLTLFNYR